MNTSDSFAQLKTLYFEGECLVVSKAGGILTQAPPGIESVESQVRRFFRRQSEISIDQSVYVGMPHRLDRPASGAMLFGQSKKVTRKLAQQFENRTVKKTYWAVVAGCPNEPSGTWIDWMRKVPNQPQSEICQPADQGAQLAQLAYTVIAHDDRFSVLEIQLETGRTHQIRLQTSSRHLPIVGDQQYGSTALFGPQTLDQRKRWIALHSRSIDFWHPQQHRPQLVIADLPDPWLQLECEMELEGLCKTKRP